MNRRRLRFQQLDDIIDDLDQLLTHGYVSVGKWNLSQVCEHLDDWARYNMDGFPALRFPMNVVMSLMKVTMGKRILRQMFATGEMKAGSPTLPISVHEPSDDAESAAEQLTETIERLKVHQGEFYASPLFGELSRDEIVKLQMIHAAHHLSFLIPNPPRDEVEDSAEQAIPTDAS